MSEEDWRAVVETNLTGQLALFRAARRHRRETADGGFADQRSYLAVGSYAALGIVGRANYAASKAGLLGVVGSVSSEVYRRNVRANALIPNASTRMIETISEEPTVHPRGNATGESRAVRSVPRQRRHRGRHWLYAGGDASVSSPNRRSSAWV